MKTNHDIIYIITMSITSKLKQYKKYIIVQLRSKILENAF